MSKKTDDSTDVRIILIDDNPAFLHITERFLKKHEAVDVIGAAGGGEKGMELVQALQPDIVLVDLAMPDISGLIVIERLREALPGIGLIALTLLDASSYRQAALAAGADDFVAKPGLVTDLMPAIRRVVQERHR